MHYIYGRTDNHVYVAIGALYLSTTPLSMKTSTFSRHYCWYSKISRTSFKMKGVISKSNATCTPEMVNYVVKAHLLCFKGPQKCSISASTASIHLLFYVFRHLSIPTITMRVRMAAVRHV